MNFEIFPRSINRLEYLARFAIFMLAMMLFALVLALIIPIFGPVEPGTEVPPIAAVLCGVSALMIIGTRLAVLDIPRMRNMGWSPWLLFFFLIPLVNLILQLMLFVVPPRHRY